MAGEWTGSAIIAGVIRNGVRRTGRDGRHDGRGGKTEPRAEETGVNPPQRSCLRADKWREFNLIYDQRPGPSPLKAHSKHRICASFNFILLFGDFAAVTFYSFFKILYLYINIDMYNFRLLLEKPF